MSLQHPLMLSRLHTRPGSQWYLGTRGDAVASGSLGMGVMRPVITKKHNFAKKKRTKDYSSDSSGTERETDKHTEGRIYRAPAGSGKDYFVYWHGKKISFGDSSMKNKNNDDGRRANFMARHNCSGKQRYLFLTVFRCLTVASVCVQKRRTNPR